MNYGRWNLYVIAFLAGFSLMVFELAAARILAPSIGSSTYVWTSVIGVIIAALSLGYFLGGKLADRRETIWDVAWISLVAALLVTLTMSTYASILGWSVDTFNDSRIQGLVASLFLFAPVSTLLGMLQPYLVKQNVHSLEVTGRAVANLSALDAIGGITGTFVAGFILFGYIGSRETLLAVAIILLGISWLVLPRKQLGLRIAATVAVLLFGFGSKPAPGYSIPIDTPSAHYEVIEGVHAGSQKRVRGLITGPNGIQSGVYLDGSDDLVFWYNQQMADVVEWAPSKQRILVLGGGAFTLPQHLALKYPESEIDVVEIDPTLKDIAEDYFYFQNPSNLNLIFNDARAFLNQANTKYDVILIDVYGDGSVPFSLATAEYGRHIKRLSNPEAVVAANIIASYHGSCRVQLEYYSAPYIQNFEHYSHWSEGPQRVDKRNTIAAFSDLPLDDFPAEVAIKERQPLTDNFAPTERLHQACVDYDRT